MFDSTRSRGMVPLRWQAMAGSAAMLATMPLTGLRIVTPAPSAPPVVHARRAAADTVIDRTIAASAGERISIDLPTGASISIVSWNRPQVRMRARLSGDQARETQVVFERVSGGLELRAIVDRRRDNVRNNNEIELWVPARFDVRVSSAGGGVTINGVQGRFSGTTGGGEIVLNDVRGESSLTTGGGEIHVTNSHLDGYITTGGGEAIVSNTTGNVRVNSGSGPVIRTNGGVRSYGINGNDVTVGAGQTATITSSGRSSTTTSKSTSKDAIDYGTGAFSMSRAGGAIELTSVPNGGSFSTGGGRIWIGSSGGALSVTTGGGDIELDNVADDVTATTGAGEVRITIVNGNRTARNVSVSSGNGRVVITLPANLDARFDLETAYTERHGPTSISSDFPVNVVETDEWDSRNGTPRRFVRGTGSVGSGRGLIRIRTVNGDVSIRRR
jgi:hypothetical protein